MQAKITQHARETIEPLVADGRTDFCQTFGDQYPVKVFLMSVGLGTQDADFFVSCVRRMSGAITGLEEDVAKMMAAWGEIAAYWTDMVAARHRSRSTRTSTTSRTCAAVRLTARRSRMPT